MAEEGFSNVGLDADAERVAPVGDDVIQKRAHEIGQHDHAHDGKKRPVRVLRQKLIHCPARDKRIGEVHERDDERADHVEDKQAHVGLKKVQKNLYHVLVLIVSGGHKIRFLIFLVRRGCAPAGSYDRIQPERRRLDA